MANGDLIEALNAAKLMLRDSYWWRRILTPSTPWDDATAAAHIHFDELPAPSPGPDYTLAELAALRPFAKIWADLQSGWSWRTNTGDFDCCAILGGVMILQLDLPVPTDIATDPADVAEWVNTTLGRIIRTTDPDQPGILNLSNKVGYLPITSARMTGYLRTPVKEVHELGDAIQCEIELTWGVTE